MQNGIRQLRFAALLAASALAGCSPISIEPTCPNTLRVGEAGPVVANVVNGGGIAEFQWEVFPTDAGTFENPAAANTRFTPVFDGDAVIRLTASDGLFQVISQCVTAVQGFTGVAVTLAADPPSALVGETITLTCTSTGEVAATVLAISQSAGTDEELTEVTDGVVTFTPSQIGDLTFSCVGEAPDGTQTDPSDVTVSVNETMPEPTGDDGGGLPPRGGGRSIRR